MPTGYTSITDKDTTFKKFVLTCARAFGVCVEMRDEPIDKPPQKIKPIKYYLKQIKKNKAKLAKLNKMSLKSAEKEAAKEHCKNLKYYQQALEENIEKLAFYNKMLDRAKAYVPPTKEHQRLKDFMIEQLESSIEYDNRKEYYQNEISKSVQLTAKEWLEKCKTKLISDIEYNTKQNQIEIERANRNNKWIEELYKSL